MSESFVHKLASEINITARRKLKDYYNITTHETPEDSILDHEPFAKGIETIKNIEIAKGFDYSQKTVELTNGRFTNIYNLEISQDANFEVVSSDELFPLERVLRHDHDTQNPAIAIIDAGFFFLSDSTEQGLEPEEPKDKNFNLTIRKGHIIGLPVSDRPAALVKNGNLNIRNLKACGTLKIGNKTFSWIGSKTNNSDYEPTDITQQVSVYNSTNCTIKHIKDQQTGTKRTVIKDKNYTPENESSVDIIVNLNPKNEAVVTKIQHGGGTNFFEGAYILQMKKSKGIPTLGEKVIVDKIDDIDITANHIDSAITVGPSIHDDLENSKIVKSLLLDTSLCGDKPVYLKDRQAARAVVYKSLNGNINFMIFDGAPNTKKFKGVTFDEVAKLIPAEDVEWAYYMDSGQTARMNIRKPDSNEIEYYGNRHYIRYGKNEKQPLILQPGRGRKVPSGIVVRSNNVK